MLAFSLKKNVFHVVQSCTSYAIALTKDRFVVNELLQAAGKRIYNDTNDPNDYNRACALNIHRSLKNYLHTIFLLVFSYFAMSIGPLYVLIRFGQYSTITCLKIPFVEAFSNLEFGFNIVIQILIFLAGFPGNIALEGVFILLMDAVAASTECFKLSSTKLSKDLRMKRIPVAQVKIVISKLLKQIQTTDRYTLSKSILY